MSKVEHTNLVALAANLVPADVVVGVTNVATGAILASLTDAVVVHFEAVVSLDARSVAIGVVDTTRHGAWWRREWW